MENVECRPRRVAIAIAIQTEKSDRSDARIWLVSSRKHKDHFVLPKGGVEKGEQAREAAARELWEEEESDKSFPDSKPHKLSPTQDCHDASFVPSTLYTVHEFLITPEQVETDWLEAHERVRIAVSPSDALQRVAWRRGMAEALGEACFFRTFHL